MGKGGSIPVTEAHVIRQIQLLEDQGVVNTTLQSTYALKASSGAHFFKNLLEVFLDDVSTTLNEMDWFLRADVVNFAGFREHSLKLKGCVDTFGATKVVEACKNLLNVCGNESRQGCQQALGELEGAFDALNIRLNSLLTLERQVLANR